MVVKVSHKYSAINVDDDWGSTIDIPLKNTDLVQNYNLVLVPGTLTGGTSPAYSYSMLNPLVSSVKVEADNETYISADVPQLNELIKLIRNVSSLPGNVAKIHMNMPDFSAKKYIKEASFPSYAFVNNVMHVTLPPLSAVTTGSPTGTSGSTLYLTEDSIERSSVNFKLFKYKMLKIASALSLTGDNDLNNYLSTDAYYQALLHFASTSQNTYTSGSNSLINYMELIINNTIHRFEEYYPTMQANNQSTFGQPPDAGFALQAFMMDDDVKELLDLSSPVINKSVNLRVNTSASGYLTTLKMVVM